jgi:hypothetical protein
LERRANKYTLSYFMVARAKIILFAQQGLSNDETIMLSRQSPSAAETGVPVTPLEPAGQDACSNASVAALFNRIFA